MVSLAQNSNTSSSGAVFFDASVNMGEEEYLEKTNSSHALISEDRNEFQRLETVPIVSVSLVLGFCLVITGIVFVCVWPEEKYKCNTYFIYLYLHCAYWFVVMVTDYLVKKKHHNLRIYGYMEFYQSTYHNVRTPLFIASLWSVWYLLLAVILHHTHKANYEEYCKASELFTPLNYVALLTTLEMLIIVPIYVRYIKKVLKFNYSRQLPDVLEEEWSVCFNTGEVGYYHSESDLEDLLEKQSHMIRYLLDYNVILNHKMMSLASKRRAEEE